jgi:hypothetical protein
MMLGMPSMTCPGNAPIYPLLNMPNLLSRKPVKFALVAGIALLCLAAIEVWGYSRGLNILIPVFFLCLLVAFLLRNAFLGWLTLSVVVAYLTLSAVTIAQ